MKRILILAAVFILSAAICSCGNTSTSSVDSSTAEDSAVYILYEYFGTTDKETGAANSFSILDTLEIDGAEYYHGRWSTLVTEDDGSVKNSALRSEFFLKTDMTDFFTGAYDYTLKTVSDKSEIIDISK